jgi:hypothetical protein
VIHLGLWVVGTLMAIATVLFLLCLTVYGVALGTVKARTAAARLISNAWVVVLFLLATWGAGVMYTGLHSTVKTKTSTRVSLPLCPENRTLPGTLARTLEDLDIAEAAQDRECRPRN